jgi:lysophospholipid acyltransferase (LPLAT)-like uncharacterized protein
MSLNRRTLLEAVAPPLGYAYIRLLKWTMRLEYRNREVLDRVRERAGTYILAFWHSRWVMMPYAYPDRRLVILLSRHRDARLLGRVMQRFGLDQAWGSSTAGGMAAVREILRAIRNDYDVAVAPDGPRGPRRRVKEGAIAVSRLGARPIIPVAFAARSARRLRSWDRTLVPFPFGRGLYVYGDPIEVPPDADEQVREQCRLRLESELDRLTDLADHDVGMPVEEPRPPVPG